MQGSDHLEQFGVEGLAQGHGMWIECGRDQTKIKGTRTLPPEPQQSAQCDKHCTTITMCIPSTVCGSFKLKDSAEELGTRISTRTPCI